MKTMLKKGTALAVLVGAFGLVSADAAQAADVDVYLVAKRFVQTINGESVAMWGYADLGGPIPAGACNAGEITAAVAQVPGPEIVANAGDNVIIHLLNCVPNADNGVANGRVSVMIPGQSMPSVVDPNPGNNGADGPQYYNANQANSAGEPAFQGRMRSQVRETRRRNNNRPAPVTYTFASLREGTFIYHSGTHMQVQVQMGLHGPLTVLPIAPPMAGMPYSDGVSRPYHAETSIFYSEIDPDIHAAVDTSNYGPGQSVTSMINYAPKYLLINGVPFDGSKKDLQTELGFPNPNQGRRVLLRVRNAGTHYHSIVCKFCAGARAIAEDGYVYTFRDPNGANTEVAFERLQETFLTPPLQTRDIAVTNVDPDGGGRQLMLDLDRFGEIPPVIQ